MTALFAIRLNRAHFFLYPVQTRRNSSPTLEVGDALKG